MVFETARMCSMSQELQGNLGLDFYFYLKYQSSFLLWIMVKIFRIIVCIKSKVRLLRSNVLHHHFYIPKVDIEIQMAMNPQQASLMSKMDGTRLPSTFWSFWTSGKKKWWWRTLLLKVIWLYVFSRSMGDVSKCKQLFWTDHNSFLCKTLWKGEKCWCHTRSSRKIWHWTVPDARMFKCSKIDCFWWYSSDCN